MSPPEASYKVILNGYYCLPVLQSVIRAVIAVLTNEEQAAGLQQPAGIGQRPKPMCKYSVHH